MKTTSEGAISAVEIWRANIRESFCAMVMSKDLFEVSGFNAITACEDGRARVYQLTKDGLDTQPKLELETKSGPIQCLAVHDITRFGQDELIVGDSDGVVFMFSNKHILSRHALSEVKDSVTCLVVIKDNDQIPVVVCSTESGLISAVRPNKALWRLDINSTNIPYIEKHMASYSVKVLCLTGVYLTDACGNKRFYLLVADNARRLHVMSKEYIVKSLPTPSNITTMTQGRIVTPQRLVPFVPGEESPPGEQVALGGANGAIYILDKFNISDEYINAGSPITVLRSIPNPESKTDLLLCAGHFNCVQLYKDGFVLMEFQTSAWVISVDTADIDGDGTDEVIISCMDKTVIALRVHSTDKDTIHSQNS